MVPKLVAPVAMIPSWPVFVGATDPVYRWEGAHGRLLRVDFVEPRTPALARVVCCGSLCRTGPPTVDVVARPCGATGHGPPNACAVLWGGPTAFGFAPSMREIVRRFLKGLVTEDFVHHRSDQRVEDWHIINFDMIPIRHDGVHSKWPHRQSKWWWGPMSEPEPGRHALTLRAVDLKIPGADATVAWRAV